MKTSLLILLSSLLFSLFTMASEDLDRIGTLHGTVTNKGEKLPYITVYVKGTSTGTSTDSEGRYALNLKPGNHIIRVQGIGFKTTEFPVSLAGSENLEIDFKLDQEVLMMEQVVVTGSRIGLLRYLPGSASSINATEIHRTSPVSSNEIFQQVSGLHTVEEEGAGLRANIGIRGLDPDKSRNVLILEDGIPVALGPYGEPEMYYTPSIDRMQGVEILKGNGQIRFGPQTIGGVINYITADPPAESEGLVQIRGGQGGFFTGLFQYGSSFGNTGYTFNYLRKQADDLGPTSFRLDDLNGKIKIKAGIRSTVNLKWSVYNEQSNATYVGITQPMFDQGGQDFVRIAPNDHLDVRRYAFSATHDYFINEKFSLSTIAYGYTTTRNWMRQDFTHNANASNLSGEMFGDPSLPEGAIYMRNGTGNRNRQFEVAGIEPRLKVLYNLGNTTNQLDAGLRFHYERAFEQRVNGKTADALSGDLRDDEIRTGNAFSAYAQNKMMFSEKLTFTYGIRMESLDYDRMILRTAGKDSTIQAGSAFTDFIPGLGLNYNFSDELGIYAGIHRGFAPPRIKDAISNDGQDMQLEAEKSWNAELGSRLQINEIFETEFTFFYMDFSNQVIPVSESSGGAGSGFINGGETKHLGAEMNFRLNFDSFLPENYKLNLSFNATFVDSKFSSDRFVIEKIKRTEGRDTTFVNISGNRTPYAPRILTNGFLTFETPAGIGLQLQLSYTGQQFTDVLNTVDVDEYLTLAALQPEFRFEQASASGRFGELPSYLLAHATVWYNIPGTGFELNASVKNIFNERYIVSRRPQGIRVGLPRFFNAGVVYRF
jgi:Fe(3+) dicitrate transport protein